MIHKVRHGRCTPVVTQRVLSLVHMQMALVIACMPPWCAQCSETLSPTQHLKLLGHLHVHRCTNVHTPCMGPLCPLNAISHEQTVCNCLSLGLCAV